mgnify:CR=1 FL=1
MLKISNLVTEFASIKALSDISFQAKPGCITTVIGANGAGKSTLLRTISGLERPTSGSITWFDEELTNKSVEAIVRSGIAQVPEGHAVISQLSVAENIELGGLFRKRKARGDLAVATKEVYDLFPILFERRREPAGSLSGGERQMLAIGRALMGNPDVLLLDEPSEGLAPLIVAEVARGIEQIKKEGLSILLVEQNFNLAMSVADDIVVLNTGEVAYAGSADDVRTTPDLATRHLGVF